MVSVDPGSTINICPLRSTKVMGIDHEILSGSSQGIQAYNGSRKTSLGTIKMKMIAGPVNKEEIFHEVDIKASFNLLLGRSRIHSPGAVPSTLYQKVKLIIDG